MPKASKKRKEKPTLQYYIAPDLPDSEENVSRHVHDRFSIQETGDIQVRYAHLAASSSFDLGMANIDENISHPLQGDQSGMNTSMEHDSPEPVWSEIDPHGLLDKEYIDHLTESGSFEKLGRVRTQGDEALRDFVKQSDLYLAEIIGLDSRGPWPQDICSSCKEERGLYQCLDCMHRELLCRECIVRVHETLVLHRVQIWDMNCFHRVTLKDLGLRIQLGHPRGDICALPVRCAGDDFIILHTNGIHEVGIDFCGCGKGNQLHNVQLIRARLFPATVTAPKTCASIELLDQFAMLSYESKMSAYQFYHSLVRLTDNTGTNPPADRYPALCRMAHIWRHLLMLKRAGRGHSRDRISGTKQGECAVICPACPHPGKNMAENWRDRPNDKKFLDADFIALDANFRASRKDVSNHEADPGLSHGYSFFVEESAYREHLKTFLGQVEEKSSCSRHDAVNMSQSKSGQGLSATGIVAIVCARHDMKRPLSVAQLQRGERHCNVDYALYQSMKDSELQAVVISYDVACQWSRHVYKRMEYYTSDQNYFMFNTDCKIKYLVPKFHLPAHVAPCRTQFSFNLAKGVGRTDGEAPERGWADSNDLAPSTKEMGPGSCRDTLDFHFGDANHKKVIGMGHSLVRKITDAAREMAYQTIGHRELESTIDPQNIEEWTVAVETWEENSSATNPFVTIATGPTQAGVRRQLAEEEKAMLEAGKDMSLDERVTPSVLMAIGLDLEQEQRTYKGQCSKLWMHSLDRQHTKLVLRGNTLMRKINDFIKFQALYIPAVTRLRDISMKTLDPTIEIKAYDIPLWLPSQIRSQIDVPVHYRRLEFNLRIAQASESLDDLRSQLQVRAHLRNAKQRFSRGQSANTRARSTMDGVEEKIEAIAADYRVAYHALRCLGPLLGETAWMDDYHPLEKTDVRDLSQGLSGQSAGRITISWIWRKTALDRIDMEGEDSYRDAVRVQWAKSRARMLRFTEEVQLLTEEMSRVRRYLKWRADDWDSKGEELLACPSTTDMHAEGIKAYARRQSLFYNGLLQHFAFLWTHVPAYVERMEEIIADPDIAQPGELEKKKRKGGRRKGGYVIDTASSSSLTHA